MVSWLQRHVILLLSIIFYTLSSSLLSRLEGRKEMIYLMTSKLHVIVTKSSAASLANH